MSTLVIGLGERARGDDAVGLLVADAVHRDDHPCEVIAVTSPTRLLDAWDGHDDVVVVDAVHSGRAPGELSVIEVGQRSLPIPSGAGGSHGFGLAEVVELGRALGRLPKRLVLVGVEARSFAQGADLTPAVADAVLPAAALVIDLIPVTEWTT